MPFQFMVWNQGNDGMTMGIRCVDVNELANFAAVCTQSDVAGEWANLNEYLQAADIAAADPPPSYTRIVNIVWLNTLGYGIPRYFPGRTLVVTRTGNLRQSGGYASQGYSIVDPQGFPILAPHHQQPIRVEYIAHEGHDCLVVLP